MERELVKVKSDNPAHSHGYYTQFKDMMKPGDVVYGAAIKATADPEAMPRVKEPKPAESKKRKVKHGRT